MELTEEEIREILDLIDKSDFGLFELETGSLKLSVAKHGYKTTPTAQTTAPSAPQPEPTRSSATAALQEGLIAVESPMVGTFYAAANPGGPPFIQEGARVETDTTLGLIEVMKVFTAVTAGTAGVVSEILIGDGQSVEYGQVLFGIDPAR